MKIWFATSLGAGLIASGILMAQQRNGGPPDEHAGAKMASETKAPGDPEKGQALFSGKGGCNSCHRVGSDGSPLGPNLTQIASDRSVAELQRALLDPDPNVAPRNQLYKVVTREGKSVVGKLLNQDPYSIQMVDAKGNLIAFQRSDLRESNFAKTPPMPSYRDRFSAQEQTDMIAYLASLKSVINGK